MDEARHLFAEGIAAADAAGDVELAALGSNRLGEEYLKQGDLARAEGPLLEAYRVRELHHLALDSSYRSLGRLRLEQGDLDSAAALLDRAIELSARPQGAIPSWDIYHYRGRVRLAQGRLPEALDDLRIALRLAREWRWSAPPEDAVRVGAEGWLDRVHGAFLEAGNRLYRKTGDRALIRETFAAVEENRANSLRTLTRSREIAVRESLPAPYWEAIARLQRAEIEALRSPKLADTVLAARAELVRVESEMGPSVKEARPIDSDAVRQALDPDTALLSFHVGPDRSWLWALDRQDLSLYELPGRGALEAQVRSAAEAIRADRPDSGELAATLFGQLPPRLQKKTRWLVALDAALFGAPLAALRDGAQTLAERHAIEIIPGAGYWLEARSRTAAPASPLFVGIGDPIYNTADSRLTKSSAPLRRDSLALPRLVASSAELDASAGSWAGDHVLLKGADASTTNLHAQLARNPAVVHLATHVVESHEPPAYGLIALSLTPRRENELLSPVEIAAWRTTAGLVVMSGCDSGRGDALPGTGLLGLTRAWLAAGAGTVIASNWSTPDDSGALFRVLYRNLSTHPELGPATALRSAQLEMIRSGGWRANPRYWGAYFAMGAR
jgi:tetratricopeptide (TPR) repeat protein